MKIKVNLRFLSYKPKSEDSVEVHDGNTADQLLGVVSDRCNIPRRVFKVVVNGKPVKGTESLKSFGIIDGTQLRVFVNESASREEYVKIARSIFGSSRTEEHLKLFALHFEKSLSRLVDHLSLDDIERYAAATS